MSLAANLSILWRGGAPKEPQPEGASLVKELVELCNAGQVPDVSLYEQRFAVLDTETTGLRPDAGDEIISVGCVEVIKAKIGNNRFGTLVDPGREVPALATSITGISNEDVQGQPLIEEIIPPMLKYIIGGGYRV